MNNDFYKNLDSIDNFSEITINKNYTKMPSDWLVLVCDIRNSTKAIEEGKYKHVNFIAALSIIGILNIEKDLEFPYIFGGDGATLIIPAFLHNKAKKVFIEVAQKAKEAFDLSLRIGIVSIEEIEKRGAFIEICKYKISQDYSQAIIRGNGLELAEELLKKEYKKFKIDERFTLDYNANFEGLECRWEDIKSRKDETISILIKSIDEKNSNRIYKECLEEVERIAGSHKNRNPINLENQLKLSFNPKVLNSEASIFAKNNFSKYFIILKLILENFWGFFLMKFSIGKWKTYKNKILKTSDTEKFDDMLRMVISINKKESIELENYLELQYKNKNLAYGIHRSNSALMTCLIFQRHGKHVHFVDGSKGGYSLAAKELKNRLNFM